MTDSTRKSFVFSPEAVERLEALRKATRQETDSNVIRLALMVLEDQIKHCASGGVIVFKSADGSEKQYHPLVEPDSL